MTRTPWCSPPGRDFEGPRQGGALDDERVIPRAEGRRRDVPEDPAAIVHELADLAVHGGGSMHDASSIMFGDELVSEADAEERPLLVPAVEERASQAGHPAVPRMARPGGEHHGVRVIPRGVP